MRFHRSSRRLAQRSLAGAWVILFLGVTAALLCQEPLCAEDSPARERAFPGAEGWAAFTPAGRGGRILRVTTLAPGGPGSLLEAIQSEGARIIVFEVGGVIDLQSLTSTNDNFIHIIQPFVTIAGQTAPSPGITLIRGGVMIDTHDVVIQHLRVRPGTAGYPKKSGWEPDGISTRNQGVNVIIDHCSLTWAIDENLSVSGSSFEGATPEEWRRNTSHCVTFSHNLIAEGLSHATHARGEHSKGSLIMDNATEILIVGNLYAHCSQRHPLAKGGTQVAVVNNLIFNPGVQAIAYRLPDVLWHDRVQVQGRLDIVGNKMLAGPNTSPQLPLLQLEGIGDLAAHLDDNLNWDQAGKPVPLTGTLPDTTGHILASAARVHWPPGLKPLPAAQVEESVLNDAGARPWDRDAIDQRIIRQVRERAGRIIDQEQDVGGYPAPPATHASFNPNEWNLRTMVRKGTASPR